MNIQKNSVLFWLPTVFVVSFILRYMGIVPVAWCNILCVLILVTGILYLLLRKKNSKTEFVCILFCIIIFVSGISSGMHTGNLNISLYIKSMSYLFIALFLLKSVKAKKLNGFIFYGMSFFLIGVLVTRDIEAANTFFIDLSRNYYSILTLVVLILYYDSMNIQKKIPMLPAIFYFVISVLAVGRGGILTAILLISGLLSINYWLYGNPKERIYFICLAIVFLIMFLFIGIKTGLIAKLFNRFFDMGMVSYGRSRIIHIYINMLKTSLANLLLGGSNTADSFFLQYDGNLHNSFLQMHCTYGLFFSVCVILRFIVSMWNCYKYKKYMIVLLGGVFIVRAMVDFMGFAFFSEFLFYYFGLYDIALREKKIEK